MIRAALVAALLMLSGCSWGCSVGEIRGTDGKCLNIFEDFGDRY